MKIFRFICGFIAQDTLHDNWSTAAHIGQDIEMPRLGNIGLVFSTSASGMNSTEGLLDDLDASVFQILRQIREPSGHLRATTKRSRGLALGGPEQTAEANPETPRFRE